MDHSNSVGFTSISFDLANNSNTATSEALGLSLLGLSAGYGESEINGEIMDILIKGLSYLEDDCYNAFEETLRGGLKMADNYKSYNDKTLVYDVLANGALMNNEHKTAKYIFERVIKRLLNQGAQADDFNVLFLRFKLTNVHVILGDIENSEFGYKHCVQQLEKKLKMEPENKLAFSLYIVALGTYGNYLTKYRKLNAAIICFKKAYQTSVKLNGKVFEINLLFLNNLGSLYMAKGNLNASLQAYKIAEKIGKDLPELNVLSIIYINMGYIYFKQGNLNKAKTFCAKGMNYAVKHDYEEGKKQSKIFLDVIENDMNSNI